MKFIVAADITNNEYGIGQFNNLVWHIPEDLNFFKQKTVGKTLVVGYNTFTSLPTLKDRDIWILTRKEIVETDNIKKIDLEDLLSLKNHENVYLAGGVGIYELIYQNRQINMMIDGGYVSEIRFKKSVYEYDRNVFELARYLNECPPEYNKYQQFISQSDLLVNNDEYEVTLKTYHKLFVDMNYKLEEQNKS